jgi:hypothetical protein
MTLKTRQTFSTKKWYVSFVREGRKEKRTTATFETEGQAKAFACKVLATGLAPTAGTLNPHLPKRTISSRDVRRWVQPEERLNSATNVPSKTF